MASNQGPNDDDPGDSNSGIPLVFARSPSTSSLLANFQDDNATEMHYPGPPFGGAAAWDISESLERTGSFEEYILDPELFPVDDSLEQARHASVEETSTAKRKRSSQPSPTPEQSAHEAKAGTSAQNKRGSKAGETRGPYNCGKCGRPKQNKDGVPHNCPFVGRQFMPSYDASTNTVSKNCSDGYAQSESPSANNIEVTTLSRPYSPVVPMHKQQLEQDDEP